jgi:hypothetical protein
VPALSRLIVLFALAWLPPGSPALAAEEVKKLHVLVVLDTEDELLTASLAIDKKRIRHFLKTNIPEERYALTVIEGKDVTPERIVAYYRDLKVEADDGLLCFYGGHGATDPEKGHYLKLACRRPLVRSELRKAMEAKRARLTVILSDCCSTPRPIARPSKVTAKGAREVAAAREVHPTVRCLLFRASGTVDVTAATTNASWSDTEKGGLFTRSVCRMMTTPIKALDIDRDGFVSWQEFFPQLRKETERIFRTWSRELRARGEKIEDASQRPHSFLLGNNQASRTYAVVGLENGSGAALVYRWRWPGQDDWKEERLQRGQKRVHFLPWSEAGRQPPKLEVVVVGRGSSRLTTQPWTGQGEPVFGDGKAYRLRPGKK